MVSVIAYEADFWVIGAPASAGPTRTSAPKTAAAHATLRMEELLWVE
jgi:hypothetical protein